MSDLKLDEDMRRELLGVLPFSSKAVIWHTPETYEEIAEEYRPKFQLRCFSKKEAEDVRSFMLQLAKEKPEIVERKTREYVRKCIVGWENLIDLGLCEYIEYAQDETGGCDKDLFASIPVPVVGDIFHYLAKMSGLLQVEKRSLKS